MSDTNDNGKCWSKIKPQRCKNVCLAQKKALPVENATSSRNNTSSSRNNPRHRHDVIYSLPLDLEDRESIPRLDRVKRQHSKDPDFIPQDLRNCFSVLSTNQAKPHASGILIANNAILTVHHFRRSTLYRSSLWKISNEINANTRVLFSCKPISPLKIANEDLEILILDNPIINIEPALFASKTEIEQAKTGLIVGYGNDENGVSGVKRERKVSIELCSTNSNYIRYNCNSKRHLIVKAPGVLQTVTNRIETDGINPRDSGCPLYINCRGTIKLAGIAARSLDNGEAGLFIRVDTYVREIKNILEKFKV